MLNGYVLGFWILYIGLVIMFMVITLSLTCIYFVKFMNLFLNPWNIDKTLYVCLYSNVSISCIL